MSVEDSRGNNLDTVKDASYVIPYLRYAVREQETAKQNDLTMDIIDGLSGADFETVCAYLMLYDGFLDVEQTAATGDYGVDIIARKGGITYGVQCKRHRSPVGNKPVQEVFAGCAHYGCDRALVMTNSVFTKGAVQLAKDTGVELFDRYDIQRLLDTWE